MSTNIQTVTVFLAVLVFSGHATAEPAGSSFGYQGQLKQGGVPVSDECEFEFSLWRDETSSLPQDQIGPTLVFDGQGGNPAPIVVTGGLFNVPLAFGATAFTDDARWLEVAVRCPVGVGDFATLSPRERIAAAPHALHTRGLVVDDAGQVGIGTAVPHEMLELAGNMVLRVEGFDPFIQLGSDDAADATAMRIKTLDGVGFAVTDDRDDPLMVVRDSGEVGIGVTIPRADLEVRGTSSTYFHVTGQGGDLVMNNDGHVGIGTTTPDAILQVAGTTTDAVARIEGTGDTTLDVHGRGNTVLHVRGAGSNNKLLEVSGTGNFMGNHIALFDSQGTPFADGIAIRLDPDHTNRENNFITFLNGQDVVTGRIEGFDLESGDWIAPPPLLSANLAFDPAVAYNPNWLDPGSLPTADFTPGQTPSLAFQWDLPSATFQRGTLPSLTFNGGSLPAASMTGGSFPTLDFDNGTRPTLSTTTCSAAGVSVICGISFTRGASPTADLVGGSFPSLNFTQGSLPTAALNPGTLPSLNFDPGSIPAVSWNKGTLPSLAFSGGSLPRVTASPLVLGTPSLSFDLPTQANLDALYCWAFETGNSDYLSLDPVGVAVANLKQSVMASCKDEGVTYGSKGADYAEWLPKLNPEDRFQFGQIVGVIGGKVSLKTEGAEQIMAVSRAPVVIGNVPQENEKHKFTTVGFMGQLPVVVRGKAVAGDYIVPSGLEDGTAVAVAPGDLELKHLGRTLGRAWSDSDNDIYSLINVAIGLNGNEEAVILERQRDRMDAQDGRQTALAAENVRLQTELASLQTELRVVMTMVQQLEEALQGRKECAPASVVAVSAR